MANKLMNSFKNVSSFDEESSPLEYAIQTEQKRILSKYFTKTGRSLTLKDDAPAFMSNFSIANFDPATVKFPGYPFLMSLTQNPLIRNGVQRIANDMTKRWGALTTDDDTKKDRIDLIEKKLQSLYVRERFKQAQVANGYYGGALIYIEVLNEDGTEPSDEELKLPIWDDSNLEFAAIKLAGKTINRLKVIEPWNFTALGYNTTDPTHKDFYEPTYYTVLGKQIHASRFLRIRENYCPQILAPIYNFLGIPTAQLAFDYAYGFESSRKSIVKLITKYSLTIFGTDIKPDENSTNPLTFIQKRIDAVAKFRNNNSMVVYDKETEELGQINTPISGLEVLWMKNLELMTIPFQLPIVKLLGSSPSGFSTGDTELTNYYDAISTNQVAVFDTEYTKLAQMINYTIPQENRNYADTLDIGVMWNPIKTMSDKEIAEINKLNVDTDVQLVSANIISAGEARDRLAKSEKSEYNGIDPELVPEVPDDTDPFADPTDEPDIDESKAKGLFGGMFKKSEK